MPYDVAICSPRLTAILTSGWVSISVRATAVAVKYSGSPSELASRLTDEVVTPKSAVWGGIQHLQGLTGRFIDWHGLRARIRGEVPEAAASLTWSPRPAPLRKLFLHQRPILHNASSHLRSVHQIQRILDHGRLLRCVLGTKTKEELSMSAQPSIRDTMRSQSSGSWLTWLPL